MGAAHPRSPGTGRGQLAVGTSSLQPVGTARLSGLYIFKVLLKRRKEERGLEDVEAPVVFPVAASPCPAGRLLACTGRPASITSLSWPPPLGGALALHGLRFGCWTSLSLPSFLRRPSLLRESRF